MRVRIVGHMAEVLSVPPEGLEVLLDAPITLGELVKRLWNVPFSLFMGAKVGDLKVSEEYVVTGHEEEIVLLSNGG